MRESEGKNRGATSLCCCTAAACVGLLAAGVWVNLIGYGGVFLEPAMTDASFEAMRYAYHAGRVAIAVLFVLTPLLFERLDRTLGLSVPLIMCFCTVVFALAYHQTLLSPLVLAAMASFVLGFGYLWIVGELYRLFTRVFSIRRAIAVTIAGQIAEQLASTAATYWMPAKIQIVICCLCPLVVLVCLGLLQRGQAVKESRRPYSGKALSHTCLLLVVSGVSIVALGAVSSVGIWGNVRVDYVADDARRAMVETILACALLAVFAVASLLPAVDRPLSYRYQVPFLIIVGGFMLATLQPYATGALFDSIGVVLTAAEYFSHVLTWVIVMAAIKDLPVSPYRVMGTELVPYSICSVGWIFLLEVNQGASMLVVLAVSYLLVIAIAVHPRLLYERNRKALTSSDELNEYTIAGEPEIPLEGNSVAVIDMLQRRCQLLGTRYRLSRRETQVLELLAQGRTRTVIQEELVLSEGTVKTHVAHIYDKMGVGSHQEVLDIVYGRGEGRDAGSGAS